MGDDPAVEARAAMVEQQLAARGIRDPRVLDAMRRVPRHIFAPRNLQPRAYEDRPVPIGDDQTMSQPYMVALMTELLALAPEDRVLEVGTGSGYQAAILSLLVREVVTIERHRRLAAGAWTRLHELGITNVRIFHGDGSLGYASLAPYEGIIVTAAGPETPQALLDQLADGGRLVCPSGNRAEQKLLVIRRDGDGFEETPSVNCLFVPLLGAQGWKPEELV